MRAAWILVALLACKKAEPPPPRVTPTPAPPVITPADAAADASAGAAPVAHVDLLRAVPSTVRVSSTVKNAAILPAHLVDRDLKTAWNSATGELVGAWIDIEVPAGSVIRELRVTSGFTATGPKGEDYFTLNPRIAKLRVTADGQPPVTLELSTVRRDLQTFAVTATTHVRIEIAAIVAGSKKTWREASMSELEVWGTPPPTWTRPTTPLVPTVEVGTGEADDPCATIDAARDEFIELHKNDVHSGPGGDDHNYPPNCETLEIGPTAWGKVRGWCSVGDEIYGPKQCFVQIDHAGVTATLDFEDQAASALIEVKIRAQDVVPGARDELIVSFAHLGTEAIAVCRSAPRLACTDKITIAEDPWRAAVTFANGAVVLAPGAGAPPPADVIGAHPLVFK